MLHRDVATRTTRCVGFGIYCIGIVVWSLFGQDYTLDWAEVVAMLLAGIALIGLVAHGVDAIRLPFEQYAYLVTGFAGFSVTLLYLVDTSDRSGARATIALLLLAPVVLSYGAYLTQDVEHEERHG